MLIRRVMLENYGCYSGRVEFDLMPRKKYRGERPIILIGGNNGSGKTTLLDAIKLGLYGKTALGPRKSNVEYETILTERIHRRENFLFQPHYARIGIEFDYVSMGSKETIYVERGWSQENSKGVREFLQIQRNGSQVESVTPDFWRGFIEELIPERLSQLFFLDGEKIENLAQDETGNSSLADSIKTLLGLDIVEKLKADLSIYASREAKKISTGKDRSTLEAIEITIEAVVAQLEAGRVNLANTKSKIDGVSAEIRRKENQLNSEGQVFAGRRNELITQRARIGAQISEMERKVRDECENTLPFAFCPTVEAHLSKQLTTERQLIAHKMLVEEIAQFEKDLSQELSSGGLGLEPELLTQIYEVVHRMVKRRVFTEPREDSVEIIHGLSDSQHQQIMGWLEQAGENSLKLVKQLGKELEQHFAELRHVEKELSRVPDQLQLDPLLQELGVLNQRLAELRQIDSEVSEFLRREENKLNTLTREKAKFVEMQRDRSALQSRIRLAHSVREALDNYLMELTALKVTQLQDLVADCFNRLLRKGALVKSVHVDPQTFSVTLHDHHGKVVPKESLSSGEKQIYAVAVLWGLAKTCGRSLPLIIDTPLARLDSEHRRKLVEYYFPFASHQVILFSTDTEVDKGLFAYLRPNLSHCYCLRFDELTGSSEPLEGYFWKEREYEGDEPSAYPLHG